MFIFLFVVCGVVDQIGRENTLNFIVTLSLILIFICLVYKKTSYLCVLFSVLCGIEHEKMESPEARIIAWLQETRKVKEAVPVSVKEEVAKPKMMPKSTAKIHIHIPN